VGCQDEDLFSEKDIVRALAAKGVGFGRPLDGDREDVMTDDVEERLDEIEQRIVSNMGARTKGLYLAFKKKGGNFGDVIDLVVEEQFPGFGRDVDDHLAEMFETFLSEHE
jgi:hypothetical protein